jgi:hypothetical protein
MPPPQPPERASAIVGAVVRHVGLDLAPIRAAVVAGLAEPSAEFIGARAEAIAEAAVVEKWAEELVDHCRSGLAQAHESFLLTASRCLEAAEDLEHHGAESWIARAVRHRLAFDAAWDALAQSEHVTEIEWCADGARDDDREEAPIGRSER